MSSSDTAAADGGGDDGGGGGGRTKRIVFHLDDADSNPFAAAQTPITTLSPTAQVVSAQQHVVTLTADTKRIDTHDDIKQPFAAQSDAAVDRVSAVKAENARTISASAPSTLRSPKSTAAGAAISPYAISLLSSSAVFRSYHISSRSGKVDFQDIRLFATFPHHSIPDERENKETEMAAAAAVPSLHWGSAVVWAFAEECVVSEYRSSEYRAHYRGKANRDVSVRRRHSSRSYHRRDASPSSRRPTRFTWKR